MGSNASSGNANIKDSKTVAVPTILNETSTVNGKETFILPASPGNLSVAKEPSAEVMKQGNVGKQPSAVIPSSSQETITQSDNLKEGKPVNNNIVVIPYEGGAVTIPFKQEQPSEGLDQLNSTPIDKEEFGDKVLQDIAHQQGSIYETAKGKENGQNQEEKTAAQPTAQDSQKAAQTMKYIEQLASKDTDSNNLAPSNKTAVNLEAPQTYINVSFNIFNGWTLGMDNPTFPPRLKMVQKLDEAVSKLIHAFYCQKYLVIQDSRSC